MSALPNTERPLQSRASRLDRFWRQPRLLLSLAAVCAVVGPSVQPQATALALSRPATAGLHAQLQVAADRASMVAEVATDSVEVRAYPKADSVVRKVVDGDLLRVTGQAPGIDGDTSTWWATTEGFVPLEVLQPASNPQAAAWTLPEADLAPNGWWGEMNMEARVRTASSTNAPVVGTLGPGQRVKVLAEEQGTLLDGSDTWYRIDGGRFAGGRVHGSTVTKIDQPTPNTTVPDPLPADNSWITVDRGAHTLTLMRASQPALSQPTSPSARRALRPPPACTRFSANWPTMT